MGRSAGFIERRVVVLAAYVGPIAVMVAVGSVHPVEGGSAMYHIQVERRIRTKDDVQALLLSLPKELGDIVLVGKIEASGGLLVDIP